MADTTDFGGLLFGGASGLEGYLTPEQQQGLSRSAMLAAGASLLANSGPRRYDEPRINTGQIIGQALMSGMQGYNQAAQGTMANMMVRQKLEEAQREKQLQQYLLGGVPSINTPVSTVAQAEPVSGTIPVTTPTTVTQQVGASGLFSKLTPEQRALAAMSPKTMLPKILEEELKRESFNILTPAQATAMGLPADATYQQNTRTGQITPVVSAEATPTEVRLLKATGTPVTMANIMAIRRSGAVQVNMSEGQKGFENESNLKKMFSNEPIYKDFNDMQSAFKQVKSSLKQENPIGDVAAATKIMKLLDPSSVVRESELGISMAAAGKMDRLQNYVENWSKGTKLTPTQRQDFQNLANELYSAAGQTYNMKRNEYVDFGSKYNLDANKALGAPAKIPSLMKDSGAIESTGATQQRRPLGAIFGVQPQR